MTTLSRTIVQAARAVHYEDFSPEVRAKVKIAFLDMLSCVFESLDLPQSVQAIAWASRAQGGRASVFGTPLRTIASDAAFVNAILGHGLVREDMHTGSVSHLGVVIFPTLLALAQQKRVTGTDFLVAVVCGYETGAAVGNAVMDQETVRRFRPTGITGPLGGAVAGSLLMGLSEDACVSALGLAANTTVGLNEWPAEGADEMFFHVGFAARNAVTAVELAELGAYTSETALDGKAGLFAALGRAGRESQVAMFQGPQPEIMAVYHKPAPACNYAQTACQAALALAAQDGVRSSDIRKIGVKASAAALGYPGCNSTGPFERVLKAKMSIQYCVAATLSRGSIEEANYRLLQDPEVHRLIGVTTLEEDRGFSDAYPRIQGAEVSVTLENGETKVRRLPDVIPATHEAIRERYRCSSEKVLGAGVTRRIEAKVEGLEFLHDVSELCDLLAIPQAHEERAHQ
jgi:2-methylcitrate dehydratase PrpD